MSAGIKYTLHDVNLSQKKKKKEEEEKRGYLEKTKNNNNQQLTKLCMLLCEDCMARKTQKEKFGTEQQKH